MENNNNRKRRRKSPPVRLEVLEWNDILNLLEESEIDDRNKPKNTKHSASDIDKSSDL